MLARLKTWLGSLRGMLVVTSLLALFGMALSSIPIDAVTFRNVATVEAAAPVSAPYIRVGNDQQEITLHFDYHGFGNPILRLTPRYCFTKGFSVNDTHHAFPDGREFWCMPLTLNLTPDLREGDNTLTIIAAPRAKDPEQYSPNVGLTAGPVLFGAYLPQTLCAGIFLTCMLALLGLHLSRQGFSLLTCCMFLAACGVFLDCLNTIAQYGYSLDMEKHIPYIQYMSEHFFYAHGYTGPESWHPPLYYMACALIAQLFAWFGVIDPWTGIRLFSILCYVTFLYFGAHILARLLSGLPFYLALALLLFWPSGLLNAAWVFNDVLMYPLFAMVFYYTLLWYETDAPRVLNRALIVCGIAFVVKTTALVPAGILGVCALMKLFRKRTTLRALVGREYVLGRIAVMIGILCNISGMMYDKLTGDPTPDHLGGAGNYLPTLDQFFLLDIRNLLANPFFTSWDNPSPWTIEVQTMLFTNSYWRFTVLGGALMGLLFIMLAYIAAFVATRSREQWLALFPLLSGLLLPFIASVVFTLLCGIGACMDFRYIQPTLIAFAACFMLSVQETRRKDYLLLYYMGNSIAMLLPVLALIMYYVQMHP